MCLRIAYDKNLTVPETASAVQLEQRVRAKVQTPFNGVQRKRPIKSGSHAFKWGSASPPFWYPPAFVLCFFA